MYKTKRCDARAKLLFCLLNLLFFYVLAAVALLDLRACLHGSGGPQIGEVTCSGSPHISCKRDQIKMRDYMDRWVTSSTWGPLFHVNRPKKSVLNSFEHLCSTFSISLDHVALR